MAILLFLDKQASYPRIRIVTGKVSMQGLEGCFDVWVNTVPYLNTTVQAKAYEQKLNCHREAIVRALELLLCKVLLTFGFLSGPWLF